MDNYRQRFFALLLPISIVTTLISLFYLTNMYGHSIKHTFPLASVFGFLSGIILAFIGAFIFLVPPKVQNTKANLSHRKSSKTIVKQRDSLNEKSDREVPNRIELDEEIIKPKPLKEEVPSKIEEIDNDNDEIALINTIIEESKKDEAKPTLYTMMILINKGQTFELVLEAIETYHIGQALRDENQIESLHIQMPSEIIKINITTHSRHSSEVSIQTIAYKEEAKKIVAYLKAQEDKYL